MSDEIRIYELKTLATEILDLYEKTIRDRINGVPADYDAVDVTEIWDQVNEYREDIEMI